MFALSSFVEEKQALSDIHKAFFIYDTMSHGGIKMKHQFKDGVLYFYFYGDLDNLTVSNLKQICIDLIDKYQPVKVKLDFEEVTFVDSTGIGFVLARYKQLAKRKAELAVCNLSQANHRLFAMSGIFQIIKEERNGVKL